MQIADDPEAIEDLLEWFRSPDREHPFSFAAICGAAGATPEAILERLPVRNRVLARRYTPDYLRAQRARLGLTQAELADHLGLTKACVAQWEQGRRPIPERLIPALEGLFFPPGTCRCGRSLVRLESGGWLCPGCAAPTTDDAYCQGLDRGQWVGAIFLRR